MILDQYGGVTEHLRFGPDDEVVIEQVEDVQPVLDANKAAHTHGGGWNKARDFRHVARVPQLVWMLWERRYGPALMKDRKLLRRLLNDPDWRNVRVSLGGF